MYNISLTTSYFPAQTDAKIRDITVGELWREIATHHPDLVEMMGIAGADYVFIDGEHGSFSLGDIEIMCRAAELVGMTPIARVPSLEPAPILQFVPLGALGIIAPHIQTVEEAQQLVEA